MKIIPHYSDSNNKHSNNIAYENRDKYNINGNKHLIVSFLINLFIFLLPIITENNRLFYNTHPLHPIFSYKNFSSSCYKQQCLASTYTCIIYVAYIFIHSTTPFNYYNQTWKICIFYSSFFLFGGMVHLSVLIDNSFNCFYNSHSNSFLK